MRPASVRLAMYIVRPIKMRLEVRLDVQNASSFLLEISDGICDQPLYSNDYYMLRRPLPYLSWNCV